MNQLDIERKYNKRLLAHMLSQEINISTFAEVAYNLEVYRNKRYDYDSKNKRVEELPGDLDTIINKLITGILRCNGQITTVQQIASGLAEILPNKDYLENVKTALEIIAVNDNSSLYELLHANYEGNPTGTLAIEPKITPSNELLETIEQFHYVPPNVERPYWHSNKDGGLSSVNDHCILGQQNQHNKYQALDSLNMLQNIEWELDSEMLLYPERSNKPLDTAEKVQQFQLMSNVSRKVYDLYKKQPFYFIWKFDKRGRMYSQGYHINLQSTDYKKSLLNFSKKEVITR